MEEFKGKIGRYLCWLVDSESALGAAACESWKCGLFEWRWIDWISGVVLWKECWKKLEGLLCFDRVEKRVGK